MSQGVPVEFVGDLGEWLRRHREAKKLSLADIASQTKVGVTYLKAIEENQYGLIPNMVSAKGFLRSYARCLELDEAEVLRLFSESLPKTKAPSDAEVKAGITSYIRSNKSHRLPIPLSVVTWGGVAILFLLAINLLNFDERPQTTPRIPAPRLEHSPITPEPLTQGPSTPELPAASQEPVVETSSSTTEKQFILVVEAMEHSWVKVVIDGSEVKEALLQAHEKVQWEAKEKFLLTTGNAGGIRVNLNGKDLGPLGPRGKVLHNIPFSR